MIRNKYISSAILGEYGCRQRFEVARAVRVARVYMGEVSTMSPSFPESPLTGGEVLTSHPTTPSEPSSLSNFRQSVTSIQAGLLAPPKNYNARLVQTRAYDICKSIIKEESS